MHCYSRAGLLDCHFRPTRAPEFSVCGDVAGPSPWGLPALCKCNQTEDPSTLGEDTDEGKETFPILKSMIHDSLLLMILQALHFTACSTHIVEQHVRES